MRFNITSRWIQAELLCEEDLKARILTLKHFLKVAAVLLFCWIFCVCFLKEAISFACSTSLSSITLTASSKSHLPLWRLLCIDSRKPLRAYLSTISTLPQLTLSSYPLHLRREQTAFQKAMEIVDGEGNYKKLRQVLKGASLPSLPYLGMYLTELIYADVLLAIVLVSSPKHLSLTFS